MIVEEIKKIKREMSQKLSKMTSEELIAFSLQCKEKYTKQREERKRLKENNPKKISALN